MTIGQSLSGDFSENSMEAKGMLMRVAKASSKSV